MVWEDREVLVAWVVLKAGQVGAEEGELSIKAKHQLSWGLSIKTKLILLVYNLLDLYR